MHLQCSRRGHNDNRIRSQTRNPTFDITKLFHTHVRAESTFGEYVSELGWVGFARFGSCEFECDFVGEDGRVAVGDVGEWTCVYEYGGALGVKREKTKGISSSEVQVKEDDN
jgi:hypothetical protein